MHGILVVTLHTRRRLGFIPNAITVQTLLLVYTSAAACVALNNAESKLISLLYSYNLSLLMLKLALEMQAVAH